MRFRLPPFGWTAPLWTDVGVTESGLLGDRPYKKELWAW